MKETHYCLWDEVGKWTVRALCGAYIRRRDHSNDPTCPACRAVLAERNALVIE